jgi:hypothetical protein
VLLKRFARVVATCGLLLAGYFGYCRAFAAIAAHIGTPDWRVIPYDPSPSKTLRQTMDLARDTFGPGHWTSDPKKAITYYDAERGYWIFFQRYARKNGGQRIEFSPFAIIWGSKGKKNHNTLEGDLAYVDFDKPFDLVSKPGAESARIVRAMIEGAVRLRDDKGTRDNPGDDLTIGPLLSVAYDEATHRIRSDSPFELRERDIVATATGLTIDLIPNVPPPGKPPGAASGFSGAKTVWLHQNIRIFCEDVGRVGVVPGGKQATAGERRAGDLRCDGPAQFNLPQPRPPGAPEGPPQPVIAQFFRNVVVRQGPLVTTPDAGMTLGSAAAPPDQLNADQLELTLVPADRPAPVAAQAKAVASAADEAKPADPMAGLTLREAVATGHAVWLQSPAEGLEARGNELRYEKRAPAQPDRLFFRGNRETKVEKVTRFAKGPKAGQVEAVDILRTLDVTIYLAAKPGETPTVIARGPGNMETRADRNQPVERSAEWGDKLIVQTVETSAGTRRRITLTGTPRVVSPTQGTITAQDRIIAYLKPKERPAASAPPASAASGSPAATEAFAIDWVEGHGGVHMAAVPPAAGAPAAPRDGLPGSSRTLHARKILYVVFAEAAAKPGTPAPAGPAGAPAALPGAKPAINPPEPAPANATANAPAKKAEPALSVEADEVWARVLMGSLHGKPELEEVRLRKGVTLHQDAAAGKARGTDATGEAIDFVNRGEGRAWLEAHGTAAAPARVVTDTFLIEGPKLGVDQAADFAWVKGTGRMVQEGPPPAPAGRTAGAGREVVPTAFLADEPAKAGGDGKAKAGQFALAAKGPVTITWRQEMQFYGRPADTADRNAWALFLGDVKVVTADSSLSCGQMKAFLDGPVEFRRADAPRGPDAPPEEKRPKPRIATVRCLKNVDLVHRQAGPDGKALEQKGRVAGQDVSYSLATGRFVVEGAGVVWLYKPKGQGDAGGARGPLATPAPAGLQRTALTVALGEPGDGDKALFGGGAKARQGAPLELTRVAFNKRVQGRVGRGDRERDADGAPKAPGGDDAPFLAEFLGGVQVLNAPIADENADLDPDDPPGGFLMLTSEALKVVREVPPGPRPTAADGAPAEDPAEQLFIDATGDPQALAPPRSIRGDRITYDSVKELVYVYGDEGGVSIINQDGAGQPFSASRGRAVMYNRKSGRIEFIDPKNVLLIDPRSGIRERPQPPGAARPPAPPTIPRNPVRAVPRNDKERRSFNGR